jgi:hypothetical protein
MPSSSQPLPTQALHTLIAKLVPHAAPPLPGLPGRLDEYELEEREERMKELVEYCTDMLTAYVSLVLRLSCRTRARMG